MTSAIEIIVLATFLTLSAMAALTLWRWKQEDEEPDMERWECDHCGTVISATTIEALIDGYRIHEQSIYCPRDEEESDDEDSND